MIQGKNNKKHIKKYNAETINSKTILEREGLNMNDKQCISDALWAFYYLSCKKEYCSLLNNDDLQSNKILNN